MKRQGTISDENGPIEAMLMQCLKVNCGTGMRMEATPPHLPPDEFMCPLHDIIYGPLEVNPIGRGSRFFDVPNYQKVVEQFNAVKNMDRNKLVL